MSGGRGTFDGQHWREELLRKRTKEALERYRPASATCIITKNTNGRHSSTIRSATQRNARKKNAMSSGCASRQKPGTRNPLPKRR